MRHWDSYNYPEDDPKVKIIFGPQQHGAPVIAWIGLYGTTVIPPKVNVKEQFSLRCTDEAEARKVMNAHADEFIKQNKLVSVLLNP